MNSKTEDYLPTRQSLLSRLKDWEDQASWKEFFDTYWKLIYHTALKSGLTDAEAQDVVQETVFSVAKHIPGFTYDPQKGSFKTWMLTMTRWRVHDQLKKRQAKGGAFWTFRRETSTSTSTLHRIPDPHAFDPGEQWDELWESHLLEAAIERVKNEVDPKHFQVFDLCVLQGWKPRKVSAFVGISSARIYLIKHRLSKAVKKEFERLKTHVPIDVAPAGTASAEGRQ